MSRCSTRVLVALIFSLLAFAASAHAVCAWVLWSGSGGQEIALGGHDTLDECLKTATGLRAKSPKVVLACLPDTVDPRGPKAK